MAPCCKRKWFGLLCTKKASIAVQYLKSLGNIVLFHYEYYDSYYIIFIDISLSSMLTITCLIFVSSRNISTLSTFVGVLFLKEVVLHCLIIFFYGGSLFFLPNISLSVQKYQILVTKCQTTPVFRLLIFQPQLFCTCFLQALPSF